jgi:AcrR family transcriptional regulator
MNRPVDHARRAELLNRVVDYALVTGVTTLALRPVAAAIGTSARMLVHHFGARDRLAAEVLIVIETRLVATLGQTAADGTAADLIRRMWTATTASNASALVRAAFEIWGRALVRPAEYADFLSRAYVPFVEGLASALESDGAAPADARRRATLAVAAFNGLQLARLTTGADGDATGALELMIDRILSEGGPQ